MKLMFRETPHRVIDGKPDHEFYASQVSTAYFSCQFFLTAGLRPGLAVCNSVVAAVKINPGGY